MTIEQRIKEYQELLLTEKYPAQFIIGVLFGLRVALYIGEKNESQENIHNNN